MSVGIAVWSADDLAKLGSCRHDAETPIITPDDVVSVTPGYDLWDVGPVRTIDGAVAMIEETELWLALSAPATGDPGHRHDIARLRLLANTAGAWDDLGPLFPEAASLGSREWAGSAVYDPAQGVLDVLYTAVGGRDGTTPRFAQRIVSTTARLTSSAGVIRCVNWAPHREVLAADGVIYESTAVDEGEAGFIKGFRDPYPFRDPADGRQWVLFCASKADSQSAFNGVVGLASRSPEGHYRLEAPVLDADGLNNELERPHVVVAGGAYYLFFSTQRRTFAPGVPGPTGLYGFVAPALRGPYTPLNGSGLVLANPRAEPAQAYSWFVLPDLRVASFIDFHSLGGQPPERIASSGAVLARRHFGGTIAPLHQLALDGSRATRTRTH